MADEPLRKLIKDLPDKLSEDTKNNIQASAEAQKELDKRIETQKEAQGSYEKAKADYDNNPHPNDGRLQDDLREGMRLEQEKLQQATEAVNEQRKSVNEARNTLAKGLTESEKIDLERVGAEVSRAEASADDAIVKEAQQIYKDNQAAGEARALFEKEHGRVVEDLPKPEKGPSSQSWITYKDKEGKIVFIDENGKLSIIAFDRSDPDSIKAAAKKLAALRQAGESIERLSNLLGGAMLLLFIYDAVETVRGLADKKTACRILSEYINLVQRGDWGTIAAQIHTWEKELTGPLAALGGYFNYIKNILAASKIDDMLNAVGQRKRGEMARKMRKAWSAICSPPPAKGGGKGVGKGAGKPRKRGRLAAAAAGLLVLAGGIYAIASREEAPSEAKSPPWKALAATASCDCDHVSAGLLTGPYREQCQAAESGIADAAVANQFEIGVDESGKLIGNGPFCDSVASGPGAWPLRGGPASPPAATDQRPCRYVGGIVQWECP